MRSVLLMRLVIALPEGHTRKCCANTESFVYRGKWLPLKRYRTENEQRCSQVEQDD